MRVLFLTTGLVNHKQGGSGQFNEFIYDFFQDSSDEIEIICLASSDFLQKHESLVLKNEFIKVFSIPTINSFTDKINKIFQPIKLYESVKLKKHIVSELKSEYDLVLTLGLGWAIAAKNISSKKIFFFGDPIDQIYAQHIKKISSYKKIALMVFRSYDLTKIYIRHLKKINKLNKNNCLFVTFLPSEHKRMISHNIPTYHLRWFANKQDKPNSTALLDSKGIFHLAFLGDMHTTYSNEFIKTTLKSLQEKKDLLKIKVSLKLIGRNWQNYELDNLQNNGNEEKLKIEVKGFVDNLSEALQDVFGFIYIEDYETGVRTRVLTAMAMNKLVIVHSSATLGIPELIHDENCLIVNSVDDFIKLVNCLPENEYLNRIKYKGYKTWEELYSENAFKGHFKRLISESF